MVRHLILWKLKEGFSPAEAEQIKQEIKEGLEGLVGQIEGLHSLQIQTQGLPSSTADLMLDSLLESQEALAFYAAHPAHQAVANGKVRPFVEVRLCLDFEE